MECEANTFKYSAGPGARNPPGLAGVNALNPDLHPRIRGLAVDLEGFLRTAMREVKRGVGDLRLYPLRLLCDRLIAGLRGAGDVELASEILAVVAIMLRESSDVCNAGLQTYVNNLPGRDPLPHPVKLSCP
jgi:hypothetical protein